MPPPAPSIPPPVQPVIKLFKLVKKARQLGCETFSGTVDVKKLAKENLRHID